jgi:hypothetical protein
VPGPFNISSPQDDIEVDTFKPVLEVTNSFDVDEDALTYAFEVYSDSSQSNLVTSVSGIAEGDTGTTDWLVGQPLEENTQYYWKGIVTDEHGAFTETVLSFFAVNTFNDAPQPPGIIASAIGQEIQATDVDLIVNNSTDADGDTLEYFFELDSVQTFDGDEKIESGVVVEQTGQTGWPVSGLQDETWYFWRVKANDGSAESAWTKGRFFVNLANDSPAVPTLKNPADGAWVGTSAPKLEVNSSADSDNDSITYQFEVYDEELNQLVAQGESAIPVWIVAPALNENRWYRWKARAVDEHGLASE